MSETPGAHRPADGAPAAAPVPSGVVAPQIPQVPAPPGAPRGRMRRWVVGAVITVAVLAAGAVVAVNLLRDETVPLTWMVVPTDDLPAGAQITSIDCPTTDECWLAGNPGFLARMAGGEITPVTLADFAPTSVACRAVDDCWAGSASLSLVGAYHFDGRAWQFQPLQTSGDFACAGQVCWVDSGGFPIDRATVWDGRDWHTSSVDLDGLRPRGLFCASVGDCIGFGVAQEAPQVFRLDGGGWSVSDEAGRRPYRANVPMASWCASVDDCMVLSTAWIAAFAWAEVGRVAGGRWDGTDAPNRGLPEHLAALDLTCTSTSNCFIVGADASEERLRPGTYGGAAIWQWDGHEWRSNAVSDELSETPRLYEVACASPRLCWAGGVQDGEPVLLRGTPA